jgi:hypothetical protein
MPLWRVVRGPEWAASVAEADPGDDYFRRNLEAIELVLSVRPFGPGTGSFIEDQDEDIRLYTTSDVAAGYRVVTLFRVNRDARTVELGWVTLESLRPGDDDFLDELLG